MKTTPVTATIERLAAQGHLIGAEWRAGSEGGTFQHHYAATGAVQAEIGLAGAGDIDAAVARGARGATRLA